MNDAGRAFAYTLQPFLQHQQWHLDRLRLALARSRAALLSVEQDAESLRLTLAEHARRLRAELASGADPRSQSGHLVHMVGLQQCIEARRRRGVQLAERCRALETRCVEQQCTVDGLLRHREDAAQAHALAGRRRTATEADRAWLARMRTADAPHAP